MKRALRIAVSPGYTKSAQAGISAEDAARYEAAIEAKDAALDACIDALVEAAARIREAIAYSVAGTYHAVDLESRVGQCDAALEEARKAREL